MTTTRPRAEETIRALLERRDPGRTICPSEAARELATEGEDFRPYMPEVRAAAVTMASRGELEVTQRGKVVDVESARGPVRLGSAADPE